MNQPAPPQAKRHLGQILIDQGILTEDQLRIALLEQTKSKAPVGKLLVQLGTSAFGVVDELQALLLLNTLTTSIPFPPPRCASILPWMYMIAIGDTLAQYFEAATGATALKRFSPLHSSCTTI